MCLSLVLACNRVLRFEVYSYMANDGAFTLVLNVNAYVLGCYLFRRLHLSLLTEY